MAELFIELLSEEIPANLQIDIRQKIKQMLEEKLKKKEIGFNLSQSFSTPQRLVFFINGIPEKIEQKGKIIKGPKVDAPEQALDGFIKSNKLNKTDIYKEKINKGEFYFAKTKTEIINVLEELKLIIPDILQTYSWKKSMKWSTYDLNWGRPLKSIIALFNNKIINFDFFHLKSNNLTSAGDANDEKIKRVSNFNSYLGILKSANVILDQEIRKKIITKKMNSICSSKKLKNHFNEKLLEEVINLVEKPNVILCKFKEVYLKIPEEILIVTMQQHQKYFPLFDSNNKLTNMFLLVANMPDVRGYVKIGNQRVIEARLSDAKFFWEKNKNQSLVKQVSRLKDLSFFNKLGTFYGKTQRLRKLANIVSEQLNLSKEKVEIAASICKADLVSDLVGEYPELQGVMGRYFAKAQGFEEDVCLAISEHYLPVGINSAVPKKPISIAVALIDKIDMLVGFFGINEKPTSSKDPFALRRSAIGLLRIIIENKLVIRLRDLISYAIGLFEEQGVTIKNSNAEKELLFFLKERMRNILREKKIKTDIIEASLSSHSGDNFLDLYRKNILINKYIDKDIGKSIVGSYKRACNIIENVDTEITGAPDAVLFRQEDEKALYEQRRCHKE